ncbi:MAG: 3-hydroxyacyl-CoA dehydrogenase NAD-binding domain-containing protein, partial [Syntrophomonas sp.]
MEIKKIGVLGAGTMGAGIAQVAAEAGFSVILVDIETAI